VKVLAENVPFLPLIVVQEKPTALAGVVDEQLALFVELIALGVEVGIDFLVFGFLLIVKQVEDVPIAILNELAAALAKFFHFFAGVGPDGVHFLALIDSQIQLVSKPGATGRSEVRKSVVVAVVIFMVFGQTAPEPARGQTGTQN
jgi:hypothetical protein